MFSKIPFYSILFSIYPIANLYANNIMFVPFRYTWRAAGLAAGIILFFLLCFRVILKSWEKAGILCSLIAILFFSFGHVAILMDGALNAIGGRSINISTMAWIWLAFFLILTFFILRSRLPDATTLVLNITALALIIFPAGTIASTLISAEIGNSPAAHEKLSEIRGEREAEKLMRVLSAQEMPDIYYIVLDSYERADVLKKHYGFDNSEFIESLKQRNFYVADSSRSNFLNTTYSLNTAFNITYYNDFPKFLMQNSRYNLQTNYVVDFLRKQGYKIIVYDSGTGDSNNIYTDVYVSPEPQNKNEPNGNNSFESLLIRTAIGATSIQEQAPDSEGLNTNLAVIDNINRELEQRRTRITHAIDHLPDYASQEGRYFMFAHIYLPHKPFLYGPNGKALNYQKNMGLYWYEPNPENYIEQYIYQIEYENQVLLKSIDKILETTQKPVVIILQSDHGDDYFLDWYNPDSRGVDIRSSNLSAIYFSDGQYEDLYPTMTTVNTFRLVFNHWFGTQFPLLAEKVFFHKHIRTATPLTPPEFIDSCEHFDICIPDPPK